MRANRYDGYDVVCTVQYVFYRDLDNYYTSVESILQNPD